MAKHIVIGNGSPSAAKERLEVQIDRHEAGLCVTCGMPLLIPSEQGGWKKGCACENKVDWSRIDD